MLPFILISILLYPQKVAMLSQRIFFLTFIGDTRIVRFAATSIGIIRIGHRHSGNAHITQHRTESLSRKKRIRLRTILLAVTPSSVSALFPVKEGRKSPNSPKRTVFPSSISSDMMSTRPVATKSTVFLWMPRIRLTLAHNLPKSNSPDPTDLATYFTFYPCRNRIHV